MNDTTVSDVLAASLVLEVGAVRMLAEDVSEAWLARLRRALAGEAETLDDVEAFRVAEETVHRMLLEATENKSLLLLYAILDDLTTRHAAAASAKLPAHPRRRPAWRAESHQVHVDLLDLIAGGDADGAERLWRAHVRTTNRASSKQIGVRSVLDLFD